MTGPGLGVVRWAFCTTCGRRVLVNKNGTIRVHRPLGQQVNCGGSGQEAA